MKVLVWISWWVDSAVSARFLKEQWYEVTWWFMKNYVTDWPNCTTKKDAEESIKVCKFLWIRLIAFDFVREYNERIIQYIYDWYGEWITPNPDVLCNNLIKFDLFLNKAIELWFDKIATGHYARVQTHPSPPLSTGFLSVSRSGQNIDNQIYRLFRWLDYNKDQSYFLSWLNQSQLSRSLFPIGEMTKPEVRKLAQKIWLPNANRKDSQWLCFIWQIPIKKFLEQKLQPKIWKIINLKWEKVWEHQGAYFFTIGQRHWLNLPFKAYVIGTDIKENLVIAWEKESDELYSDFLIAKNRHRIADNYPLPLNVKVKIRYRQEPQEAILQKNNFKSDTSQNSDSDNQDILINFKDKQRAVAPWQTVVAYINDECIWNWTIM